MKIVNRSLLLNSKKLKKKQNLFKKLRNGEFLSPTLHIFGSIVKFSRIPFILSWLFPLLFSLATAAVAAAAVALCRVSLTRAMRVMLNKLTFCRPIVKISKDVNSARQNTLNRYLIQHITLFSHLT